jgi:ankyrin repeat protein
MLGGVFARLTQLFGGDREPVHPQAIFVAYEDGDADGAAAMLQTYLKQKGDPDVCREQVYGAPLLHYAALEGQASCVEALLACHANASGATDRHGYTPVHAAVIGGHADIVRLLVAAGADVDARSLGGTRPIHLAAVAGDLTVVKALVAAAANLNAVNDRGLTPLHYAAMHDHSQVAICLAEEGGDLTVPDADGHVPAALATDDELQRALAREEARQRREMVA